MTKTVTPKGDSDMAASFKAEVSELKRTVHEEILPQLTRYGSRLDSLEKNDNELTTKTALLAEEHATQQTRTNERLARMDTKIDTIAADTKQFAAFVDSQSKATEKIQAALDAMSRAWGFDEGGNIIGALRKDAAWTREHREADEQIKVTRRNTMWNLLLAVSFAIFLIGLCTYLGGGKPLSVIGVLSGQNQ